jgi:hypothetical protein
MNPFMEVFRTKCSQLWPSDLDDSWGNQEFLFLGAPAIVNEVNRNDRSIVILVSNLRLG